MGHQRRTFFTCPLRASVGSSTRQRRRCPSHILHLHEDFHSVQRGRAGARDGPRHCTRDQLLPPAARALLLLCELVWDGQTVTYVQHLVKTQTRLLKSLLFMDAGHSAEISFGRITLCPRYKTHSITGVSVYGHNKYCTTFWFHFTMRTYFDRKPNFTHTDTHFSFFWVHFHSHAVLFYILATLLAATLDRGGQFTKPWMRRSQGFPLHIGWNSQDLFALTNTDLSCLSFSLRERDHWAGWKPSSVCMLRLFQINMSSVFPKAQRRPVVPNMERWQSNTTPQGNTRGLLLLDVCVSCGNNCDTFMITGCSTIWFLLGKTP